MFRSFLQVQVILISPPIFFLMITVFNGFKELITEKFKCVVDEVPDVSAMTVACNPT